MKAIASGKLNIRKRPLPEFLTLFVFFMPFFLSFFQDFLRLPALVKYTIDVAWVMATALLFLRRKIQFDKRIVPFLIYIGIFFLYTLFFYILNFQSPFYFLWGFRNNFRFYFAFILFCVFLYKEDIKMCFKFLDVVFYIDAVVAFFQFFVLGYKWDFLGGIFGADTGCNAYTMVFFTIVISKSVLQYMNKEEKLWLCATKCVIALVIAAMSELKFFFVVFIVMLVMATLFTSFSMRKIVLIVVASIIIMFAGSILTEIFGENSTLSFERIIELVTTESYSSTEDLGRFTAISKLSNSVVVDPVNQLFGLGLGNCDTSSFAVCNSEFYQIYSHLNYTWFSSAFLFLELGLVGLGIYLFFFIMCFVFSWNQLRKDYENKLYYQLAMIISVVCVLLTFYNSSLRFEVAYMIYFVLALPVICSKSDIRYQRRLNVHT